jgi:sugar lactone lactonase YvrE
MYRFAVSVSVLVTVSLLLLAGCGGGGGGGTGVSPVSAPSTSPAQQVYILDFVHHKVTVAVREPGGAAQAHAQFVDANPGQGAASSLALTLTFGLQQIGDPGIQQMNCVVTNNTAGIVGQNDLGTTTGLDLCFVTTVFSSPSATVSGGGYEGYDYLDPANGTPVYHLNQSLAPGATSNARLVDIVLPTGVTKAMVAVLVRADTGRAYPPDGNFWCLSTLAGKSGVAGYENGPAGAALFNTLGGPLYRDDQGDLLVPDILNNCVRRVFLSGGLGLTQGFQVTTWAGTGSATVCDKPFGLARGPAGNVYIGENGCVSIVGPKGGNPTVIYGKRGSSTSPLGLNSPCVAVSGNRVYFAALAAVGLLTNTVNPFTPADWNEIDITHGAGFISVGGLAVDALGNLYATDYNLDAVFILPNGGSAWSVIGGTKYTSGENNGTGNVATFAAPLGIAVDQSGIVYVAELDGSLRRMQFTGGSLTSSADWLVDTMVPKGSETDGLTGAGSVSGLQDVTCARDGTLYLTESDDIRRLDRSANDAPPS